MQILIVILIAIVLLAVIYLIYTVQKKATARFEAGANLAEMITNTAYELAKERFEKDMEFVYVYIEWPESQNLMEENWFRSEAILDTRDDVKSSCYLIPYKRVKL